MSLAFGFALPHWQAISGGFSPQSLFTGGVQGVLFDISDLTTMFTTSAGTTPVAMPGQGSAVSVGAMLDKRATGYSLFFDGDGDYLSTPNSAAFQFGTGDFTIEFWIYFASILDYQTPYDKGYTSPGGLVIQTGNGTGRMIVYANGVAIISESGTGSTGTWIHYALVRNGSALTLYRNGVASGTVTNSTDLNNAATLAVGSAVTSPQYSVNGYLSNFRIVKGTAVYTGNFTPPTAPLSPISGTSLLTCGTTWSGNPTITKNGDARIDGLNPFTASPVGNHAIAANDTTARPELRARVNLLTYSTLQGGGAAPTGWTQPVATGTSAPSGTAANGDIIYTQSAAAQRPFFSQNAALVAGTQYRLTCTVNSASGLTYADIIGNNTGETLSYFLDGASVLSSASVSPGVVSITWSSVGGTTGIRIGLGVVGNATGSLTFRSPDLRPANIGANVPAYQRIADANTYDTSGFPLYLFFDGIDDSMYTPANLNLSGTDKATVFAGVRKNDNTNAQAITELSAAANTNNGAFWVFTNLTAGGGASSAAYALATNGTAFAGAAATGTTAPITNVLSGALKISTSSDNTVLRVNGAQVATSGATSSGTGNFGTYPLYIGSRANSSVFLNGHLHSLIIAGSAVSAGNISATEQWVANKTGLVIP